MEKPLLKSVLQIAKDSECNSMQHIPKPRYITLNFLFMEVNTPMSLGAYVPTSEARGTDVTVGHQHHITISGVSRVLGKITKAILDLMVRFPLYKGGKTKTAL